MPNVTGFDTEQLYILIPIVIYTRHHKPYELNALLDTGAPKTEFSDKALMYAGFIEKFKTNVQLKSGLQTQKYGRITLPRIDICSHNIDNLEVFVSRFEESWGIDALIGLDFFRMFRTTIDYKEGAITTERLNL